MPTTKLTLKLLINTTTNKVLFAEANKEAIDFLFGLLELPLATVVKLLISNEATSMAVSIVNLYKSIQALDDTYLQSNGTKATLLDPLSARSSLSHSTLLLLNIDTNIPSNSKFYRCGYGHSYDVSDVGASCPQCNRLMAAEISYISSDDDANEKTAENSGNGDGQLGFVSGVVTYTIMDDLTVTPMSTISSITMLNKFHVKDVSVLREMTVHLGFDEGLALLRASLQSSTALSDVFLKNVM